MKRLHTKILSILLLFLCILSFNSYATIEIPSPTEYKYINDYVGIMNSNDLNSIISIGKELEDKTGAQEIIVIIDSTNGIDIDSYANSLFRNWGIGESNKDNGLLILLSLKDKAWRIEVGRGLEGAIPDIITNKVMTSLATPQFANGNYNQGLLNAYSAFSDYIAAEYNVSLDKSLNISLPYQNNTVSHSRRRSFGLMGGIFAFALFADIIFNRGRISRILLNILFISNFNRRNGPPRGGSSGGGGFGGFGGGSSNGGGSSGTW